VEVADYIYVVGRKIDHYPDISDLEWEWPDPPCANYEDLAEEALDNDLLIFPTAGL
jgi:hypothetical protein